MAHCKPRKRSKFRIQRRVSTECISLLHHHKEEKSFKLNCCESGTVCDQVCMRLIDLERTFVVLIHFVTLHSKQWRISWLFFLDLVLSTVRILTCPTSSGNENFVFLFFSLLLEYICNIMPPSLILKY